MWANAFVVPHVSSWDFHVSGINCNISSPQTSFEIVGSLTHLASSLGYNVPLLRSGRVSTVTLVINLNWNHWTTLVVTKREGTFQCAGLTMSNFTQRCFLRLTGTAEGWVAYYADSFGRGPNRKDTREVADALEFSLANVETIVTTLASVHTPLGIEFVDVSAKQQHDSSSCGVYALENANRYVPEITGSHPSLANV